jgi:PQQ-dependent catabolism-associated CXXCW motif protein
MTQETSETPPRMPRSSLGRSCPGTVADRIAPRRGAGHGAGAGLLAAGAAALLALAAAPACAESAAAHRARTPALFDAATGYRIDRHRAPTPDDAPGARTLDGAAMRAAAAAGAILIDVTAEGAGVWFEGDGEWVGHAAHETAEGAVWLPQVGHGRLPPDVEAYFRAALARLTGGEPSRPLVIFCHADCWMSWNAAKRAAAWGHEAVGWAPLGIEGWAEAGGALAPAAPYALPPSAD